MFSKSMLRVLPVITFALPCLALAIMQASAMSVRPVVLDMAVSGRDARASIQVINDGAKPMPVEFEIFKIDLDAKGEKLEKPAGDEFLVFPPQAIVPPGATQVFRVQWAGNADLKTSQSYIFSVNQIPVKLKKEQSGVQLVFNFAVIVNVAPPGGHALLKQVKSEIGKDEHGVRRPVLIVENPGNMHAYLSEASIRIEGGNFRRSIPAADLRQLIGLGLVQPGKRRRFILPVDLPPAVAQITTALEYIPKQAK
jgi:P pilus assembly chaperone PapD